MELGFAGLGLTGAFIVTLQLGRLLTSVGVSLTLEILQKITSLQMLSVYQSLNIVSPACAMPLDPDSCEDAWSLT